MRFSKIITGFALIVLFLGFLRTILAIDFEKLPLAHPFPLIQESIPDTVINSGSLRTQADIVIPIRTGFPFCETFIGFDPRPNAIWEVDWAPGLNNIAALTGQSLQLTSAGNDQNGYVFVDIPFSSAFGLKVSFEFSSYGGTLIGADGFSFFMFDGSITSSDFAIGGTGGALGYTAVRATSNENTLISPGLKGAYIGIGFDELGNFGNSRTGKFGGFEDPNNDDLLSNTPLFPHSVVVRGPVDGPPKFAPLTPFRDWDRINDSENLPGTITKPRYDSYKFIDGRIFDPASTGIAATVPPVSVAQYLHPERFELDTDAFSASCPDEGFRKVFLDLNPVDVNDPSKGYTVEVQMLVNVGGVVKLINVFNGPINYPFAAPELLKVGFAAATGLNTNFHQIRNVTVQVSDVNALDKPLVGPLTEAVCEGETNTFELDVTLTNDINNGFIRCLQLYYTPQEALDVVAANAINIPFPSAPLSAPSAYCPTGNCVDLLCRPERTKRTAYDNVTGAVAGEFEVLLVNEAGVEVPKVRFQPANGYSGQTTIYYTVTDNFGQVSDPKPITITINPLPDPIITTLDPLVWEQQEAADIKVRFEAQPKAPGYSYQWLKNGLEITGATSDFFVATSVGDYSVEITTDKGCVALSAQDVTIRIVPNLTPSLGNTQNPETCGGLGNIQVTLADFSVTGLKADGTPGNEKWRIVDPSGNIIFDWIFLSPGQKTITRDLLPAGDYLFQIGDEFRGGQPDSDGNPLFRHVIPFTIGPINPPLSIVSYLETPELCFGDGGSLNVVASGGAGNGTYVFQITNTVTGVVRTETPTGNSVTFTAVSQGDYTLKVTSLTRCQENRTFKITGPAAALSTQVLDSNQISCGVLTSGFISWLATGGTPDYTFVRLEKNGNPVSITPAQTAGKFDFSGLTSGTYKLVIKDKNSCEFTSDPVILQDVPKPVFEVNDDGVCGNETALLIPEIITLSNSIPGFSWITPNGTEINSNTTLNGITYTILDHDGNSATPSALQISGLSEGVYVYQLKITGSNSCDQLVDSKVTVTPIPVLEIIKQTDPLCFNGDDGFIEVGVTNGDLKDFEFSIDGIYPYQLDNKFSGKLSAGTYTIRVRNLGSGCENNLSVILGQPEEILIVSPQSADPTCSLDNGSIQFNLTGGVGAYSITINGKAIADFNFTQNSNQFLVSDLPPGKYTLVVTDSNACTVSFADAFELINDPGLSVKIDPLEEEICEGAEAVILPVVTADPLAKPIYKWFKDDQLATEIITSATPDSEGLAYQVNSSTGEIKITGFKIGTYKRYLQVSGDDICPFILEADFNVLPPLEATLEKTEEICFGEKNGTIKVLPKGGNGNYSFSLDGTNFQSSDLFENLAPGIYNVWIKSDDVCEISISTEILASAGIIKINAPDIIRSSCGLSNGSIENLVISGGWANYKAEWRKGSLTGPIVPGDLTGATNLAPDTYFVLIEDGLGCPVNFSFILAEQPRPDFKIAPVEICAGADVVLTPVNIVSGSSFSDLKWYKDAGKTQPVTTGPDSSNPGVTYLIDIDGKLTVSGLPGKATPYTYYLHAVCTDKVEAVNALVRVVPAPVIETKAVQCFGANNGKINVTTGGDTKYTYSVDGGSPISETQLEALNFGPKVYTISVRNEGFCPAVFSVEVLGPQAPLAIIPLIQIDPGCGADIGIIRTQITGGWAPYIVNLYKNGSPFNIQNVQGPDYEINNLAPGQYYLTVTDKEGCLVKSNTITMVYGPTQVLVDDVEICEGEAAVFSPKANPVAPGSTFEWFKNQNLTSPIVSSATPDANGNSFQIAADGTLTVTGLDYTDSPKTYYVKVTGPGVCPGFVASPKALINRLPVLNYTVNNEVCFGDQGQITFTGTAGNGTFTYSLNGTDWVATNIFKVVPGIYTGFVKSGGDCVVSIPGIVVSGPSAAITTTTPVTVDPICNQPNGSISFQISGGYGSYSVETVRNGQTLGTTTLSDGNFIIQNTLSGTYSFIIKDTNPDGVQCISTVAASIDLKDQPTPLEAQGDIICEGETANLTPTTSQSGINPVFTWYQNADGTGQISSGTSNDITYQVSPTGALSIAGLAGKSDPYIYFVKISGTDVCEPALLPVKVFVYGIPNLRVSNPSIVCDPTGTVDLTEFIEGFNSAVYDYNILSPNGSPMRLDQIETVNQTGSYQVQSSIKGSNCWSPNQRIQVIISDTELIPEFNYEIDLGGGNVLTNAEIQIQEPVQFQDVSLGKIIIWNWDFGDGSGSSEQNPTHEYQKKGTYTAILTTIDQFGCVDTFERTIQALDDYVIIVPNAFTPDGLKNQYFKPQYRGIASMEFYVFNTWGELIFEANNLETQGWDGTLNGKNVPNGNYVYRAVFTTRSGEKVDKSGVFILIR